MRITVLGASGRVGHGVATLAQQRGHEVTVGVRDSARWKDEGEHRARVVLVSSAQDERGMREAVRGAQAVVSAVGARDVSQPLSVVTDQTRALVQAMKAEGVQRLVTVGAAGLLPHPAGGLVGERHLPPFLLHAFNDHKGALAVLQSSELDWVVVCPPFIPDGERTGNYRVFEEKPLERLGQVSAGDVAELVLRVAQEGLYHRARVGIAY
jgi:putative NADH-flavin reductase